MLTLYEIKYDDHFCGWCHLSPIQQCKDYLEADCEWDMIASAIHLDPAITRQRTSSRELYAISYVTRDGWEPPYRYNLWEKRKQSPQKQDLGKVPSS